MAKKKVKKAVKKAKKAVKKMKKAVKKVKKAAKKAKKPAKKAMKKVKKAVKKAPKKAKKAVKNVKKAVKPAQKAPAVKKAPAAKPAAPAVRKAPLPYMRAPVIPVRQPTTGGATKLSMPMPAVDRPVGVVTHYYDKIGVGVLKLREPLKVGELIRVQKGDTTFTQTVSSMQINRQKVQQANANDDVALKVDKPAHEGARIYRA